MKNTKGITLIALIVTIIVLIILAGISVNLLLGDNGILQKAKDSSMAQEIAEIKEKIGLDITAKQIETKGIVTKTDLETILGEYGIVNYNQDETIKSVTTAEKGYEINLADIYLGEIKDIRITYNKNNENASGTMNSSGAMVLTNKFTAPAGKEFKEWNTSALGTGNKYEVGTVVTESITLYAIWQSPVYKQGQKVKIGNEKFYVLTENDSSNNTTIELFTMYNLKVTAETTGTYEGHYMQQENVPYYRTQSRISNTNYWKEWSGTYPLNLNTYPIPTTGDNAETLSTNALLKADDYAKAVGGNLATGRLLTREEVIIIKDKENEDLNDMLWGKENCNKDNKYYLRYLLGTASSWEYIYMVFGDDPGFRGGKGYEGNDTYSGVRPVITVSKDIVEVLSE